MNEGESQHMDTRPYVTTVIQEARLTHCTTVCISLTLLNLALLIPCRIACWGWQTHLAYLIHVIGNFHYPQLGFLIVLILPFILGDREDGTVLVAIIQPLVRKRDNT